MNKNYLGKNYDRNFIKKVKKRSGEKYFTKEDIFISRMSSILRMPHKVTKELFSQRAISAIRLNSLAADIDQIKAKLIHKGINLEKVPWTPDGYIASEIDKSDLGKIFEYKNGLFYIQNLSSMIPALSLSWSKKPQKILDMCASPGGKTLQIASLTAEKSEITANEVDFYRYKKMLDVFRIFHGEKISTTNLDGELFGQKRSTFYDIVFLDAPCSSEGQIYLKGIKPLRTWNLKKVKFMSALQKKLIKSAFIALKKGGTLIYSTCTLEPEENEGTVSYLKSIFKENAVIEPIELISSNSFEQYRKYTSRGIISWNGKEYHPDTVNCVRIIPSSQMMGFFICKIKKI